MAARAAKEGATDAVDVLMVGTGEYTTGFVGSGASKSDKGAGVIALCLIDMRTRGMVNKLHMCGVNGTKFPAIRAHIKSAIVDAYPGSAYDASMSTYPGDDAVDASAYEAAIEGMPKGSAVTIFTPDDTHFRIALKAVRAGLHVLVTKPAVMTLAHHRELHQAAREANVLVMVEVHKRFDPIYMDARDRIQRMGDFSYLNAYMSQPKLQLKTFQAWAGKSSDISYYLNSHHIDFHEWCMGGRARPERVTATSAKGVSHKVIGREIEDTITLTVQWRHLDSGSTGVAVYTSSWVAPKADVHSQQRFFYMGHTGEVRVDQAHRGYTASTDDGGFASCNPLFMKYTPNHDMQFAGQSGYGYRSVEAFVEAVLAIRAGKASPQDYDTKLATLASTFQTTAILEAGRRSLDANGRPMRLVYPTEDATSSAGAGTSAGAGAGAATTSHHVPTGIEAVSFDSDAAAAAE